MRKIRSSLLISFLVLTLLILPLLVQETFLAYSIRIFGMIGLYVILALGLNITFGFAGIFDLGFIAFYAIGAYTSALLSIQGWNFFVSTPIAVIVTLIFRTLLGAPILRLRGDYMAIVTLGFGEMVRIVLNNWDSLTNGPKGLPRVGETISPIVFSIPFIKTVKDAGESIIGFQTKISLFHFELTENIHFYYSILAVVFLAIIISKRLENSRIGRAWTSVREDETAAELSGVPVTRVKMLAFATSAIFASIAGSLFVHWENFITPESFTFWESVLVVSMVVLGGIGSIYGVILGVVLIAGFPQLLQAVLGGNLIHYRYLIFGFALVIIIIFRPQGLIPSTRQALELEPKET